MFYNTGISTYVWVISNRKPKARRGKVQLIDASGMWQKMRKSLGSKRKGTERRPHRPHHPPVWRFPEATDDDGKMPISRIFANEAFGYHTITVERPLRCRGQGGAGRQGQAKGKPQPDSSLRDTENVPLTEDVGEYFKREVLPHAPDAWIDRTRPRWATKSRSTGISTCSKPPRPLAEIDADLKRTTDRILDMIKGLSA